MTNLPTDIDEIKRVLIIFAAEIYKLAGAGNGNFEQPCEAAKQAIALEIRAAVSTELKSILESNFINKEVPLPQMNDYSRKNYSPCLVNRSDLNRYINVVNEVFNLALQGGNTND